MPLRAMLFDLWGTLFVHAPGEGDARAALRFARVQAALDALGERYALDEIRTAFDAAAREHERIHAQSLDISARGRCSTSGTSMRRCRFGSTARPGARSTRRC